MNEINTVQLAMCRFQGEMFEESLKRTKCGSATFIRNFMHSEVMKMADEYNLMLTAIQMDEIYDLYFEEYGNKEYGKTKYNPKVLYWCGYIYRMWSYLYNIPSKQLYKIINGKELASLYEPYHTMAPEIAINRIIEAKGIITDQEERAYTIMRKILGFDN